MNDELIQQPASVATRYVEGINTLLGETGIDAGDLDTVLQGAAAQQGRLPLYQALALWSALEARVQDPLLGVRLGLALKPHHFPVLGYAAVSADNLRQAIERLQDFEQLTWDIGFSRLISPEPGRARLVMAPQHREALPATVIELALSGWIGVGRHLLGMNTDQASEVTWSVAHTLDRGPAAYRALLGCTVCDQAPFTGIEFPEAWLGRTLPHRDAHLQRIMAAEGERLLRNYRRQWNLVNEVRAHICRSLLQGQAHPDRTSRDLALSPRTLRRRLADQGTRWQTLRDEVRRDLCRLWLTRDHLSLADIALALDFSDQSALTRAFRRWDGCTPSEFRKQLR